MAKKIGPKEAQLRDMREGTIDLSDIKHQFQELEAKMRAELLEKKNKMLAPLHEQAEAQRTIISDAQGKLDEIERMISQLTGQSFGTKKTASGGSRTRRSKEALIELAGKAYAAIKAAGKNGISGKDISKEYGKFSPSLKQFIEANLPDAKIRTEGERASMVYFAA